MVQVTVRLLFMISLAILSCSSENLRNLQSGSGNKVEAVGAGFSVAFSLEPNWAMWNHDTQDRLDQCDSIPSVACSWCSFNKRNGNWVQISF